MKRGWSGASGPGRSCGPATVLAIIAVILTAASAAAPPEQTLSTRLFDDRIELSVPVSRLVIILPRGDLSPVNEPRGGAAASPRYFHLADPNRGLVVSGWFEPASSYKGLESFWKSESDAARSGNLPTPRDVSTRKVGNWEAILYDISIPGGSNTHIRSEWVAGNTWIDLHISVTTRLPIDAARKIAMDVLTSIQVDESP